MAPEVAGVALLVVCHGIDAALDHPQACPIGLLDEAELDQCRVPLIRSRSLRVVPAKGEMAERLGLHDPNRHDHVGFPVAAAAPGLPRERAVRTDARLHLRLRAEPAADLLGFGYHAPDDLRARLDQDLSFDAVSGHADSFR